VVDPRTGRDVIIPRSIVLEARDQDDTSEENDPDSDPPNWFVKSLVAKGLGFNDYDFMTGNEAKSVEEPVPAAP
jgi:hypothetical protein